MDMRDEDIVAARVTMIGLADAQGGVALDDGVRTRVGSGSDEREVEKGEQKKVTSVDRHGKRMEGIAVRLGKEGENGGLIYPERAGWHSLL